MWLRLLALICSFYSCHPAAVFLQPDHAHELLVRVRRYNSGWFEEFQKGDLERECIEEKCSYEEAREVYEHTEATNEFWNGYNVPDSCVSNPCQNDGICHKSGSAYVCFCMAGFSGINCQYEERAVPTTCLVLNGGCEHFCEEDAIGRNCSCADGYSLQADGQSCVAQEPIACGMVPVQQNSSKAKQLNNARIVGGEECPKGHCPWQVLLRYQKKGFCGGVIFKPTWIITAAHCLEDIQSLHLLEVVAGEHNIAKPEGTEQVAGVSQMLVHEGYASRTADNDIALLRLRTPVSYTPYVVPVCLPTRSLAQRELWAVAKHTVSGWGRRSEHGPTAAVLQRLEVPRIRTQECEERSGVRITGNMFCAGYIEGLRDSCKGDSGGPLVTLYKQTTFLLGVVSWGKGCAQPGHYGIYTRVSNYLGWIQNRTAQASVAVTEQHNRTNSSL